MDPRFVADIDASSSVVALLVGALLVARSRWLNDLSRRWLGVAFMVLGAARFVRTVLVPAVPLPSSQATAVAVSLQITAWGVALVLVILGLRGSEAGRRAVVPTIVGVAALAGVLVYVVHVPLEVFSEDPTLPSSAGFVIASVLAAAWFLLALIYVRASRAETSGLMRWLGASFAVLGLSLVVSLIAPEASAAHGAAPSLRLAAYLLAAAGLASELRLLYAEQAQALDETTSVAQALEAQVHAGRTSTERLDHDSRSAMNLIETGASMLERFGDSMSADERRHSIEAVREGLDQLRTLHAPSESTVDVADAVATVVERHPGDVVLTQRDSAPVRTAPDRLMILIHNLLQAGANKGSAEVRIECDGSSVIVTVDGQGEPDDGHMAEVHVGASAVGGVVNVEQSSRGVRLALVLPAAQTG